MPDTQLLIPQELEMCRRCGNPGDNSLSTSCKTFVFSSSATRENEPAGFGGYHDLYPVASDVTLTGDRFYAKASGHQLSRMIILDRTISGVTHNRSAHHAKLDGFDHVVLQLLVSGNWISGPPGGERAVQPGEVIFQDMTRPQRNSAGTARIVTINLPRDLVEQAFPVTTAAHGAILPTSASPLLCEFMLMLVRRGGEASAQVASSASKAMAELIAGAFGESNNRTMSAKREAHYTALRRERAELFIESRLANQNLDVDLIACGLGISRTILYQLFKPSGGVARYILARRLERLSKALRQSSETRSVSQLAFMCGFSSESHCSRAFRAAYGVPPGQYRNEAARGKAAVSDYFGLVQSELATWHAALRLNAAPKDN